MHTLSYEIVEIYAWIVASAIMILISAIAKFYQEKFGKKTYYYLYYIPVILIIVAANEVFYLNKYLHESIELLGSLISFLLSYYLYRIMVGVE